MVFAGVEATFGKAQRGGFPRTDLAGEKADSAEADDVVEPFGEGLEVFGGKDLFDFELGCEGLAAEAEEGTIQRPFHDCSSFLGPKGSLPLLSGRGVESSVSIPLLRCARAFTLRSTVASMP